MFNRQVHVPGQRPTTERWVEGLRRQNLFVLQSGLGETPSAKIDAFFSSSATSSGRRDFAPVQMSKR
jgi:hypothetical protein